MVKIFTWCFLVLIHLGMQCNGSKFYEVADYYKNDTPTMEEIRVACGSNITLQCDADKCDSKYQSISWKFSEKEIPMNKKCMDLELTNVTINLSGFYVCLLNNVTSHIYRVEVIDPTNYDSILPRVLSVTPSNATVLQYSNIVVQCRTGSNARAPPHVFWFKRTTSTGGAVHDVLTYGNYSYVRISNGGSGLAGSPHSVPNEKNVYLSKLSIYNVTVKDSGVYACVVMTELGKDLQYFVVEVVSTTDSHRVTETLSLLFLIPLSFALIPSIVWLCYSRCYHRKQKAKCKLAAAEAAAVVSNTYSSSPQRHHRPHHSSRAPHHQHQYCQNPYHPDSNMIQMLRMGDGAFSMSMSTPEAARLLKQPTTHQTISVV